MTIKKENNEKLNQIYNIPGLANLVFSWAYGLFGRRMYHWLNNIKMKNKKNKNIKKPICLLIDTTCGYRSWNGLCNCKDNKCKQKQIK